jgi:hypothetical protein
MPADGEVLPGRPWRIRSARIERRKVQIHGFVATGRLPATTDFSGCQGDDTLFARSGYTLLDLMLWVAEPDMGRTFDERADQAISR